MLFRNSNIVCVPHTRHSDSIEVGAEGEDAMASGAVHRTASILGSSDATEDATEGEDGKGGVSGDDDEDDNDEEDESDRGATAIQRRSSLVGTCCNTCQLYGTRPWLARRVFALPVAGEPGASRALKFHVMADVVAWARVSRHAS